jgi:RND family efflux transporter MFP subunit
MPGRIFPARISRNAASLEASTRTLLVEIDVPNPHSELRPGLFVRVKFEIPRSEPLTTVPAQAIIFRAEGTQVAVVGEDGMVTMRQIVIARDFGVTVEVKDGLAGGETIALDPPADLRDGQRVVVTK